MTPWTFADAPGTLGDGAVTVMEGTTFCISDQVGDLPCGPASGLFVRDTRMLAHWRLTVGGVRPTPTTVSLEESFAALFASSVPSEVPGVDLLVVRRRAVGDGMREDLSLLNPGPEEVRTRVELAVGTDFADLFEVKDGKASGALVAALVVEGNRVDAEGPAGFGVGVVPDRAATTTSDGLAWDIVLPAHGEWHTSVEVVPRILGEPLDLHHPRGVPVHEAETSRQRHAWRLRRPRLHTANRDATEVLRRSVTDLATLRIFDPDRPEVPVVAAGAPWFMALFGRDSLLTSLMMLPIDTELATGTLTTLAAHQGRSHDPATEEEPGRILHEIRFGPAGTLALGGRNAYFGTADATPLFVVLVGELLRWRGPEVLTPGLVEATDRALAWMLTGGDPDGDGFIEYARKTELGLLNQGWKDSWDGVNFADGTLARPPIALAEVQGYAYAAYVARAEIAEALGDPPTARLWRERAQVLKERFDAAFWMPDHDYFAVGLDGDKRQIDALTSNIGHCLWTGIVADERAGAVARHLVSDELFSGWGVRTLATSMGAYNPRSYHNGSVWPHDTALCVGGLARYGYAAEAGLVAAGLLAASRHFGHRLPELFAGFSREQVPVPVPYPAACSPQAWASAAPVELMRAVLRLHPDGDGLSCAPTLPDGLLPMRLTNIVCRGHAFDIDVDAWGTAHVQPHAAS
jgi:glycogen debranching enzyme